MRACDVPLELIVPRDLAAHKQYRQELSVGGEVARVLNMLPGLALVIYGATRSVTAALFRR